MKVVPKTKQSGVMLLEAMIAVLIFSMGVLALVALQATSIKLSADAKYRAVAAMMSGSGPTVFGIFADAQTRDAAARVLVRHGYRPKSADFTHGKSKK